MLGSAWAALETGEAEEERVVAERRIEDHEEAAERFTALAAVELLVAAAGCLGGRLGRVARVATLAAGAAALAGGLAVGHSGGELVCGHGAATAYTEKASLAATTTRPVSDERSEGR